MIQPRYSPGDVVQLEGDLPLYTILQFVNVRENRDLERYIIMDWDGEIYVGGFYLYGKWKVVA